MSQKNKPPIFLIVLSVFAAISIAYFVFDYLKS